MPQACYWSHSWLFNMSTSEIYQNVCWWARDAPLGHAICEILLWLFFKHSHTGMWIYEDGYIISNHRHTFPTNWSSSVWCRNSYRLALQVSTQVKIQVLCLFQLVFSLVLILAMLYENGQIIMQLWEKFISKDIKGIV